MTLNVLCTQLHDTESNALTVMNVLLLFMLDDTVGLLQLE